MKLPWCSYQAVATAGEGSDFGCVGGSSNGWAGGSDSGCFGGSSDGWAGGTDSGWAGGASDGWGGGGGASDSQNEVFFPVLETVWRTSSGCTFPLTVTFCSSISMSKDSTPERSDSKEGMRIWLNELILSLEMH